MKKISLWATMLALMVSGLCVTSCGSDKEEEEEGGGGKKTYMLDDYVYKYWTRCERVGNNLVVEMFFENFSETDLYGAQLALTNSGIRDNVGNTYYSGRGISFASATNISSISNYSYQWMSLNIPAKSTVAYFIKIENFDPSNRATSISFEATFSVASGLPATTYTLDTSTLPITDRRVKEHGIMTNDTALVYEVTNCERVGAALQIDFTVTNNSAINLGNLKFNASGEASDDLGNSYYSSYSTIAFGAGTYKNEYALQLEQSQVRVNPHPLLFQHLHAF